MQIEDALKIINSKFIYKRDKRKYFDHWKVLYGEEKWEGDCEDYSLTLVWLISDRNVLKFLWNITFCYILWYVISPNGEGHAIVKIDGFYYDNIQKKATSKKELIDQGYKFKFPMIFPISHIKLLTSYTIGKLIS
jgi:predicted transglutaminase-like cysteine proteinase